MKLVIFDIDGVLADFEGKLVTALADEFGHEALAGREKFRLEDRFNGDILKRAKELTADPNFYYGLNPIPGAISFVSDLMRNEYPVMFASSRPEYMISVTRRWLKKYLGFYFEDSVGVYCGVDSKAGFVEDLKDAVEFAVEDSPAQIEKLKAAKIPVLAWEQKWNEGIYPRLYVRDGGELMLWPADYLEAQPFWTEEGV